MRDCAQASASRVTPGWRLLAAACVVAAVACDGGAGPSTGPEAAERAFVGNVILGRPTDRSVTASLLADSAQTVLLEVGTQPGAYPRRSATVALQPGVPAEVTLSGLTPNTRYVYRVRTGTGAGTAPVGTPEGAFHTQRAPGSGFTFVVDADPHCGEPGFDSSVYAAAMTRLRADAPDFLIDLGDNFMTEKRNPATEAEAARIVAGLRPFWAIAGPAVPLLLAIGNHEGEQGWNATGLPLWVVRARQRYYPNPVPGSFYSGSTTAEPGIGIRDGYYAWQWGDALFVVLDPYWYTTLNPTRDYWNFTLGAEQYAWLARTLRGSTARFKFVFTHQLLGGVAGNPRGGVEAAPFYEWGGRNADGSWAFAERRPGWSTPIHQLLVETGVTAVFHGHDHFYAKQSLDGIVYQLLPQPSFAQANASQSATSYGYLSGEILAGAGYLRVSVTSARATVDYVRVFAPGAGTTGTVATSYTLLPSR